MLSALHIKPAEHLIAPHDYQAPKPGDKRSPCPFLNTLANHVRTLVSFSTTSHQYLCLPTIGLHVSRSCLSHLLPTPHTLPSTVTVAANASLGLQPPRASMTATTSLGSCPSSSLVRDGIPVSSQVGIRSGSILNNNLPTNLGSLNMMLV